MAEDREHVSQKVPQNADKKAADEEHKDNELDDILFCSTYALTDCAAKRGANDVDGVAVGEDGTIEHPFLEDGVSRIDLEYRTSDKICGDSVDLTVLRDEQRMRIQVPSTLWCRRCCTTAR